VKIRATLLGIALLTMVTGAFAQEIPKELKDVGIVEHLGDTVSVQDLTFKDESGRDVRLSEYFAPGRPVLLNLVYYGCGNLCSFVLNGLVSSLQKIDWVPGKQFELVTLSIDPTETPELAHRKKESYLKSYGKREATPGWHFLTGKEEQIRKLAFEIGFGYRYDETEKQYAHSAALFVLTPEGKISRILYGIDYPAKDLRLALLEASNGRVGTVIDRLLLFCYRYDPKLRKYSVYLTRVMQTGGAGTVLIFGGYLALFWRMQRRRRESNLHV
jgi:protein SCO1/2